MSKVRIIALLCALILLVVCASACKKGADSEVPANPSSSSDIVVNIKDDAPTSSLTESELKEEIDAWGDVELEIDTKPDTVTSKTETGSSSKPASSSSKKPSSSSKTEASSSEPVSSSKPTVSTPAYFPGAY